MPKWDICWGAVGCNADGRRRRKGQVDGRVVDASRRNVPQHVSSGEKMFAAISLRCWSCCRLEAKIQFPSSNQTPPRIPAPRIFDSNNNANQPYKQNNFGVFFKRAFEVEKQQTSSGLCSYLHHHVTFIWCLHSNLIYQLLNKSSAPSSCLIGE